jgi:hypothetical protein
MEIANTDNGDTWTRIARNREVREKIAHVRRVHVLP